MPLESTATPTKASDRAKGPKTVGTASSEQEIRDLERQVHLAELRARQVEAEVRYLKACGERREIKGVRKDVKVGVNRSSGEMQSKKTERKAARRTARRQKNAAAQAEKSRPEQVGSSAAPAE